MSTHPVRSLVFLFLAAFVLAAGVLAGPTEPEAMFCTTPPRPPGKKGVSSKDLWTPGQVVDILFLSGDPERQDAVAETCADWTAYANLDFAFHREASTVPAEGAEIRINFMDPGPGVAGYSFVGRVPLGWDETMRLREYPAAEFRDPQAWAWTTTLHEFGHALGLHHEQQNPQASIRWNEKAVIDDYIAAGSTESAARHNVLRRLIVDECNFTSYDQQSIMHYGIPARWTLDGVGIPAGTRLSPGDKQGISLWYPGRAFAPQDGSPLTASLWVPALEVAPGTEIPGQVTVAGGTPPYRILYKTDGRPSGAGSTWTWRNLSPGTHFLTAEVKDESGMVVTAAQQVTVGDAPPPPPPPPPAGFPVRLDPPGFTNYTGVPFTIEATALGGTPPYRFEWFWGNERTGVTHWTFHGKLNLPGRHELRIVVTDSAGRVGEAHCTIDMIERSQNPASRPR